MMTKSICALLFFIISSIASAQTIDWGKAGSIKSDTVAKKLLEPTLFMASYSTSIVQNPERPTKKTKSTTLLQVGQRYVRFGDLHLIPYDSIIDRMGRGELSPMEGMALAFGVLRKKTFLDYILRDLETNRDIVQMNRSLAYYQYEEDTPSLDWKIVEGDSTILGYNCRKAEVSYRGRDYVAWYAPDVPLPFGPYRFGGLPGLIFKITDNRKHVDFTINGFETVSDGFPIYLYTRSQTIKTNREKARKADRNYFENPLEFERNHGMKVSDEQAKLGFKPKPYYPIELE